MEKGSIYSEERMMGDGKYTYIIVGAGLAGASAIEGIREHDGTGRILLIGAESHLPYHRPPLTKSLWFGTKGTSDIIVEDESFYRENDIELKLGTKITRVDPTEKTVEDNNGQSYAYDKLLLATGGTPRRLPIPGGDLPGVSYYRYMDDYTSLRKAADDAKSAIVIGGGFIGSEIAAALNRQNLDTTMVFPESWLCARVFPRGLGETLVRKYEEKGVRVITRDRPNGIKQEDNRYVVETAGGKRIEADIVVAGIGIAPGVELAESAGLEVEDGIVVDEFLRSSNPSIFAAGDNARFKFSGLDTSMRVEHWDNALNQGKYAGECMAGADRKYDYMPYFFSDLFDFGYEAVGEINPKLETVPIWQKENEIGIIYYLKDGIVRGALMCNVWEKIDEVREFIRSRRIMDKKELSTANF